MSTSSFPKSQSLSSVRGLTATEVARLKKVGIDNTKELLEAAPTTHAERKLAEATGISRDRIRGTFVLRQFHVEGFVNQYAMEPLAGDGSRLVFVTEAIENLPAGWRARETYTRVSPDELVEEFAIAPPGGEFEVYSEARLRRRPAESAGD